MRERGWDQVDFAYVCGDAYVDHPSFGAAIITRMLEANGYKVGVAFVKATIPMALLMLVMEALPHIPGLTWLDDMDAATQLRLLPVLIGGILIYTGCTLLTSRAAARAYEKVDM